MIFAWWMAVLADGYSSAYFRKKPMLWVVAPTFSSHTVNPTADWNDLPYLTEMMTTMTSISTRPLP